MEDISKTELAKEVKVQTGLDPPEERIKKNTIVQE